ncbi:TPA: host cell division inhibitor Icd-like protein [Escherichia coli]|nr:host cell division inhibitor Icd-like protein [Escherichia coli]HEI2667221.1 host cell division inhibitor Icd-like protein [Escherichia coli]HEI3923700.1 host cell division inhibitor Icd-like protein [Escherichia coli]
MNITKSAPLPERPCEQLTCCEKNGSVQGNYINRGRNDYSCRITGKTKATRYGGPSTLIARYPQRKRADYYAVITSGWQCDQCAGLLVGYSCSLTSPCRDVFQVCDPIFVRLYSLRNFSRINAQGANLSDPCSYAIFLRCLFRAGDGVLVDSLLVMALPCKTMHRSSSHHGAGDGYSCSLALRRWRRLISSRIFLGKKPAGLFSGRESLLSVCFSVIHQPLGSMPRRFSSARPNSLSQLARLMPSLCASLSNCSFSSGEIRILNCGDCPSPLGLLSRLIVDKWSPIELAFSLLGDHLNTEALKKAKPEGARNTNGLLTTNDSKIIEAAMRNHTTHPQGRDSHNLNKYIWRFIALSTAQPRVITIEATSEQEARQQSPDGCVMVFAARIRQEVRHVQ